MRRLILLAAVAAASLSLSPAQAVQDPCEAGTCVYPDGANVCYFERGPNGNWRTICAGADGVWICTWSWGDYDCSPLIGPIT